MAWRSHLMFYIRKRKTFFLTALKDGRNCCVKCHCSRRGNRPGRNRGWGLWAWDRLRGNPLKGCKWGPEHPTRFKNQFGKESGEVGGSIPERIPQLEGYATKIVLRKKREQRQILQMGSWKRPRKIWWCQATPSPPKWREAIERKMVEFTSPGCG